MSATQFIFPKEPLLGLAALYRGFDERIPLVDASWRVTLSHSARYALYRVLNGLIHDADDEVLLPAFSCIALVEAVIAAGYKVRFYDTPDLTATPPESVAGLLTRRTKAFVVIHFFGHEQRTDELASLCREAGILLVEDFAHALPAFDFSGNVRQLRNCDVAIFSLKKMLPAPDGGFAIYRASLPVTDVSATKPPRAEAIRQSYRSLESSVRTRLRRLRRRHTQSHGPFFAAPDSAETPSPASEASFLDKYTFDSDRQTWRTSSIALRLWATYDLEEIARLRRRNAALTRIAIASIGGIRFPLGPAGDQSCLWGLPFTVESVQKLDYKLRRIGVPVFTFAKPLHPLVEKDAFPAASSWSRQLLLLPVHQGLTPDDIQLLPAAFLSALSLG